MKPHFFIISMLAGMCATYIVLWLVYTYSGEALSTTGIVFLSLFIGSFVQQSVRFFIFRKATKNKDVHPKIE